MCDPNILHLTVLTTGPDPDALASFLEAVAQDLRQHRVDGPIVDSDGNRVGFFALRLRPDAIT